jgi:hypothetical protein
MVNRFLSNLGIRLDNFGAKSLRTNNPNRCVVGPGGLEPPTRPLSSGQSLAQIRILCAIYNPSQCPSRDPGLRHDVVLLCGAEG